MFDTAKEIYYVAWSDLRFMRHNLLNVLIMSLMSPILYVIAFGYGLGGTTTVSGVPYISFMIPGIVALSSLSSSFTSTSTRINVQRLYYKSFDEMLMCPLRYSSIVLGKTVLGMIRGLISCAVIYAIGLCLSTDLMITPMFVIVVLLSCFTYACLGETAALIAKSHQSMATFNTLVILPMTFLCGTFFSTSVLPEFFQAILYAIPLTHSSECIRSSALGWDFPWISLAILVAYAVAFYFLNLYLVKNRRV
jgi:ABC-2 type transport system permease protein